MEIDNDFVNDIFLFLIMVIGAMALCKSTDWIWKKGAFESAVTSFFLFFFGIVSGKYCDVNVWLLDVVAHLTAALVKYLEMLS